MDPLTRPLSTDWNSLKHHTHYNEQKYYHRKHFLAYTYFPGSPANHSNNSHETKTTDAQTCHTPKNWTGKRKHITKRHLSEQYHGTQTHCSISLKQCWKLNDFSGSFKAREHPHNLIAWLATWALMWIATHNRISWHYKGTRQTWL